MRCKKIMLILILIAMLFFYSITYNLAFAEETKAISVDVQQQGEETKQVVINEGTDKEKEKRFVEFVSCLKDSLFHCSRLMTEMERKQVIDRLNDNGYNTDEIIIDSIDYIARYDFALSVCCEVYGPRETWSINSRHVFDVAMVELGELDYCINLIPNDLELQQKDAVDKALSCISERAETQYAKITVSYTVQENNTMKGQWVIGVECETNAYEVEIRDGHTICREIPRVSFAEGYYADLIEQNGPFFKWPLDEKAKFASEVKQLLNQSEESALFPQEEELRTIASYGFCLPTTGSLTQENAHSIAVQACSDKYGVSEEMLQEGEAFFSFFTSSDGHYIWRVIFWDIQTEFYHSGIVEIDACTGGVLKVEKNGDSPDDYIPYADRL